VSARTGLAVETCTRELAEAMAAIPALAEAFKDSYAVWFTFPDRQGWAELRVRHSYQDRDFDNPRLPAPTVREMLAFLDDPDQVEIGIDEVDWTVVKFHEEGNPTTVGRLSDPDTLARACIEASK
jgi:hypothetical protein